MIEIKTYSEKNTAPAETKVKIVDFLFDSLEQYGDPKNDIEKSISYAFGENGKPGGLVIVGTDPSTDKIAGAVILNKTGMD